MSACGIEVGVAGVEAIALVLVAPEGERVAVVEVEVLPPLLPLWPLMLTTSCSLPCSFLFLLFPSGVVALWREVVESDVGGAAEWGAWPRRCCAPCRKSKNEKLWGSVCLCMRSLWLWGQLAPARFRGRRA